MNVAPEGSKQTVPFWELERDKTAKKMEEKIKMVAIT